MSAPGPVPSEGGRRSLPAAPGRLGAVLFDMDGLLVDTEPLWFEAERAVMARMGGGWTHADQRELIGGTLDRSVGYLRAKAPRPAEPAAIARWLVDEMVAAITGHGVGLLPGAGALLAEVTAAGVAHALVTSAQRRIMDAVLAVTGLSFPVTVCGEDVSRGKPAPEPYLRAAGLLGVAPAGCVVLEDSPAGVAAAEAAGCAVVAVPSTPGLVFPPGRRVMAGSLAEVTLARLRDMPGLGGRVEWPAGL